MSVEWYSFPKVTRIIGQLGISGKAKLVATAYDVDLMRSELDGHHEIKDVGSMLLEIVFIGWDGDEFRETVAKAENCQDFSAFGDYIGDHFVDYLFSEITREELDKYAS